LECRLIFANSAAKNLAILRAILRITVTDKTVGVLALAITYFSLTTSQTCTCFLGKHSRDDAAKHANKWWVSDSLRKTIRKKNVILSTVIINAG